MLVNAKEILLHAQKGNYGVPAPDFIDLDSARTYVQVAERMGKPIILSFAQVLKDVISLEEAALIGRFLAEKAEVPIVLHLDHGLDEAYIKQAIELGFTSVMIDASMESFEENVRRTKIITEFAHGRGVTVEAEIGHVGQGGSYQNYSDSDSIYTTTEEAAAFVQQTNVDSLAVSIGTAHGVYKGNGTPVLNFERLRELAAAVPVPLVLHGGSGSGDDNLHRCAVEGIAKINIYTDFLTGAMKEIAKVKPADYIALKRTADQGMADVLEHYFHVFSNEYQGGAI